MRAQYGVNVRIASTVIRASHLVPRFRPRPSYSSTPAGSDSAAKFRFELDDSRNFLDNLSGISVPELLRGKSVLDFGSGYGGRTAWLAQWCREIVGVEIAKDMVEVAARSTCHLSNCRFVLGEERAIRFPDHAFDVIISFDVLEHVRCPDVIMGEWFRVLKPGGTAIVIFTPYEGAFAHHLNYISLAPGLHWVFSADTLMKAVRKLSDGPLGGRIDLREIPDPQQSYDGTRRVVPTLNGLTKRDFLRHVHACGFRTERIISRPILEKFPVAGKAGAAINRLLCLLPGLDARLAHNLTAILRK